VLEVCGALSPTESAEAKRLLDRIVAMLTRLGQRGYSAGESAQSYGNEHIESDCDPDPDSDPDAQF